MEVGCGFFVEFSPLWCRFQGIHELFIYFGEDGTPFLGALILVG